MLVYPFPFGSSTIDSLEWLNSGDDGPVLFCYDQEPLIPEYNDSLFQYVKDTWPNRRIILLNTEYNSESKNYFLDKYGFEDCYYFYHVFAAHDWFRGYQYCPDIITPPDREVKKKFITFNRITGNARSYRSLHIADLKRRDLLNYGHVSYSVDCPEHGNNIDQLIWAGDNYNYNFDWAIEQLKDLDELRIDTGEGHIPNGSMVLSAVKQCMESFLFVVTETEFWTNKLHLTEKIFKPIISEMPFVLLGPPGNLFYLRTHGFRTFNNWWDESYDDIVDPVDRVLAVNSVVSDICAMPPYQLEIMLEDMAPTLKYNREKFESQRFLNATWDELKHNLLR